MPTQLNTSADPAPVFKPFVWVAPRLQGAAYDQLADARDIAAGVAIALQMVESTQLEVENGDAPLLGERESSALMRMSIASMNLLRDRIDQQFEYMNKTGQAASATQQGDGA